MVNLLLSSAAKMKWQFMKKLCQVLVILVLLVLVGCQKDKDIVSYQTDVVVSPAGDKDQYTVDFKLTKLGPGDDKQVLVYPSRVETVIGQEAVVRGGDEQDGVSCGAIITKTDGALKASSVVSVTQDGKKIWSAAQTVSFNQ